MYKVYLKMIFLVTFLSLPPMLAFGQSEERKSYIHGVTNIRPLTDEERGYIKTLSDAAVEVLVEDTKLDHANRFLYIKDLGEYLSQLNVKSNLKDKEMYVLAFGAYVGDALIEQYNGAWVSQNDGPVVQIGDDELFNPFVKVQLNIERGMKESVYDYYLSLADRSKTKRVSVVLKSIPFKPSKDDKSTTKKSVD